MICQNCKQSLLKAKLTSQHVIELVKKNYFLPISCGQCQTVNFVKVDPEKAERFLDEIFKSIKPEDIFSPEELKAMKQNPCLNCPNCCKNQSEQNALNFVNSPLNNGLFDAECPKCHWSIANSLTCNHARCQDCKSK